MPCECCGQRLPGDPKKADLAKQNNRIAHMRRWHTEHALAMGLRAEGVPEKQISRVRSLTVGMGLWGRRMLRGIDNHDYAPGMVQQWGRNVVITR